MRALLFLLTVFSTTVLATSYNFVPQGYSLQYFPTPEFKESLEVSESTGTLEAIVSIDEKGKVTNVSDLKITPENLPTQPVLDALQNATFLVINGETLDNGKILISFPINQKSKVEFDFSGIVHVSEQSGH